VKVDDEISASDEYGNWYRSTIIKIGVLENQTDIDGNSIPTVTVGFRYLDPYGQKEDDLKRKVTGWINSRWDTDFVLAQPNIQPVFALTYQYNQVQANMMTYDINVLDLDDMIYPSTEVHQYTRTRDSHYAGISAFADFLNEFGHLGGYDIMENLLIDIQEGRFQITQKHILHL
jgi:hypothetical protein